MMLTVIIGKYLSYTTSQVGNFNLLLGQVSLETSVNDFSLTGLQTIHKTGNWSFVVRVAEQNQLFIDKVCIVDSSCIFS